MTPEIDGLEIATRAWMVWDRAEKNESDDVKTGLRKKSGSHMLQVELWRHFVLIFDTETSTDESQRLNFGFYRFGEWRDDDLLAILEEGLLFADDLPLHDPQGYNHLVEFAASHQPETVGFDRQRSLMLRSRTEFIEKVLWPAIQADCLIVGFNLPFDLSRLPLDVRPARGKFAGGFSLVLWQHTDATGTIKEHQYRPRIKIKEVGGVARFGISQPNDRARDIDGRPVIYRPGFLDLHTLVRALTDRGYSLKSASRAFNVESGKSEPGAHGQITPEYIAYARQDVAATAGLLLAARTEFDRHPIDLDPSRAFSPASIAKAYYRALGVKPRLNLQPDFPREYLGYAMSAYYGGRAETVIRRTPVPVVYTDVLSMYPTVNSLLKLWNFHVAERVDVEDCTAFAQDFLSSVTTASLLDAVIWPSLSFYAQIVPDDDFLPVRAQYSETNGIRNIGVNPFFDPQPYWYAGPDLVASVLLSGKVPKIISAFRLVPSGQQEGLKKIELRGAVPVDPAVDDFFRIVIEERKRAKDRDDISAEERERLDKFLKVLANSGSYGVFVETNPQDLPNSKPVNVDVYGRDAEPFSTDTLHPEVAGEYSFPPVAALITAGARLVLALIEKLVTDLGGSYAFCDTDSMAIVATREGGLVPCVGGPHKLPDGRDAIRALSWVEVNQVQKTLESLNPYDRNIVTGSILKIEDVNYEPETGIRRQVWCLSIAAKRYALFTLSDTGEPTILPDSSRHGLGFLIDPRDTQNADSPTLNDWELALWDGIVRERLGLDFEYPPWLERPAVRQHTISSYWHLKAFSAFNRDKDYQDRVKPFNFMLTVPVDHQGRPDGIAPSQSFHLVTAFETNPRRWTNRNWFDIHGTGAYQITTRTPGGGREIAGVKSLGSVANTYAYHPESKRLAPDGNPCGKQSEGLLKRRPVRAAGHVSVGKEAHRLSDRAFVDNIEMLQGTFLDPRREPWQTEVLPVLRQIATTPGGLKELAEIAQMGTRRFGDVLAGRSTPRPSVRAKLTTYVRQNRPTTRICEGCHQPLTSTNPRQRYCSKACRQRAYERRHRQVSTPDQFQPSQ